MSTIASLESNELLTREPDITSSDPNERKLARRLRIERRVDVLKRQKSAKDGIEVPEEIEDVCEKTVVDKQLDKSTRTLDKLITEAFENISNVRVAAESREVDRRECEGIQREKLIEALEQEANEAEEMFEEIAGKWSEILKFHDPLVIHEEMESQREKCDELLKQKDGIIATLRDEIKSAERKFTEDQKKMNEDVTTLASRIEKQIKAMRIAYHEELKLIDEVILDERKLTVEMNNRKWDELYKKRDTEERAQCEKKFRQQEEFNNQMDELRRAHQERYREMKIRLERDVQTLFREFEIIKASCIINGEKLDYNYQILKKRDDENMILNSQQKRRINKLQDVANNWRRANQAYEERTRADIERLSREVQKLQRCVLEIESKGAGLSRANDSKFQMVWEMNVSDANEKVGRILKIDRLLYEQQLGLKWRKVEGAQLPKKFSTIYSKGVDNAGSVERGRSSRNSGDIRVSKSTKSKASRTSSEIASRATDPARRPDPPKDAKSYEKLLRHILHQVADRTGFLFEKRLRELLAPYRERERSVVRVDNVFAALNVRDAAGVDRLAQFFLPYARCAVCSRSEGGGGGGGGSARASVRRFSSLLVNQSGDAASEASTEGAAEEVFDAVEDVVRQPEEVVDDIVRGLVSEEAEAETTGDASTTAPALEECMAPDEVKSRQSDVQSAVLAARRSVQATRFTCRANHPLHVNSVFVIKALREFLGFYFKEVLGVSIPTGENRIPNTVSKSVLREDVKTFWTKYKNYFNSKKMRLWDGLFFGLQKYYEILKDRRKLNDDVLCLRRQNHELRKLLEKYTSKVTTLKPPCAEQRELPLKPFTLKPCKEY